MQISEIEGTIITVKDLVGNEKKFDIMEIFDVDEANLTSEYAQQASIYAYFAVLQSEAERILGVRKMIKERSYAETDQDVRWELDEAKEKYTEAVVKSLITTDEDYIKNEDSYAEAEYDVSLLKAIVNALRMRADMLVSLGAHLRQEISMTGMSIKEQSYNEEIGKLQDKMRSKRKRQV